jgi:type IV secretory pathway VirB10-like protein
MVDWAEKNADITKLHSYLGKTAQQLITLDELKAHKQLAHRSSASARAQIVAQVDTQVTKDYDHVDKIHKAGPNAPAALCFTDFPVQTRVPPPLPDPEPVEVVPAPARKTTARRRTKQKQSSSASSSTPDTSASSASSASSSTSSSPPSTSSSSSSSAPPAVRRGSQDHEAAKQLFDFLVPGSSSSDPSIVRYGMPSPQHPSLHFGQSSPRLRTRNHNNHMCVLSISNFFFVFALFLVCLH